MWGAIHSAELGDGTPECHTPQQTEALIKQLIENPELLEMMCNNIIHQKSIGTYDGAYKVVELATGGNYLWKNQKNC